MCGDFMKRLSIGQRLAFCLSGLLALVLLSGLAATWSVSTLLQDTTESLAASAARADRAVLAQAQSERVARLLFQLVSSPTRDARVPLYAQLDEARGVFDAQVATLSGPEAAELQALGARFLASFIDMADLIEGDEKAAAAELLEKKTLPLLNSVLAATRDLAASERARTEDTVAAARRSADAVLIGIAIGSVILVAAGALLSAALTRSIVRPLGTARAAMEQMSSGDLANPLPADGHDEVAQLLQVLESMRKRLRETLSGIIDNAGRVALASAEIAGVAQQIRDDSNKQADLSGSAAADTGRLNAEANTTLNTAESGRSIAAKAEVLAQDGNVQIRKAVGVIEQHALAIRGTADGVTRLKERSTAISQSVSTISEIAEQTNLLALNAAIEAARAGESGRGFAVVADEVRKLATRAASVSSQISEAIREMQDETDEAAMAVNQRAQDMHDGLAVVAALVNPLGELQEQSALSHEQLGELANAARDQFGIAERLNGTLSHIAQLALANATRTEQSATQSASLDRMAGTLKEAVSRFNV